MKLKKPKEKDIEKAMLKGAKIIKNRQVTGTLFSLDHNNQLCACALGAAALGAGMLTMAEAKQAAIDESSADFDESGIASLFPNGGFELPATITGCDDIISTRDFSEVAIELNDEAHEGFEKIAATLGLLQRLSLAAKKKVTLKL